MNAPNFLIVGAQKAGTTSLYTWLRQHPDIYLPAKKETHYFTYCGPPEADLRRPVGDSAGGVRGWAAYLDLFRDASGRRAVGEASPSYLYSGSAPARIARALGEVKIIAILREPAGRAFSNYLHCVAKGIEPLSFEEALRAEEGRVRDGWDLIWHYQGKGYYSAQLVRYFRTFGKERVLVLLFDDLVRRPDWVIRRVWSFLDVPPMGGVDYAEKQNVGGIPRSRLAGFGLSLARVMGKRMGVGSAGAKRVVRALFTKRPEMARRTREALMIAFREEVSELEGLIERDLTSWKLGG